MNNIFNCISVFDFKGIFPLHSRFSIINILIIFTYIINIQIIYSYELDKTYTYTYENLTEYLALANKYNIH